MALHIRDEETDELVRRLAEIRGVGLTEAVRDAVKGELDRIPLWEKLRPMREWYASLPDTGLKADKAFFDELSGEVD